MGTSRTAALAGQELKFECHAPTVWQHASFAEDWYHDARREAQGLDGRHSKRREIVFAASFLESYIFEWVRLHWFEKVNTFSPPASRFKNDPLYRAGLKEKWSYVPPELHRASLIPRVPSLDLSDLGTPVVLRNGLLHARASRPATGGQVDAERPRPAVGELDSLDHGWPLGVAIELVKKLHADLQTTPPSYL